MLSSEHVKTIQFDRTRRAYCFFTTRTTKPQDIISGFDLNPLPKGIICISGGAAKFPPETIKTTIRLTEFAIAPLVYRYNLLIVDGGTEAGVMKITGKILRKIKYTYPPIQDRPQIQNFEKLPLIGFVPESRAIYPGVDSSPQREVCLDPNHSYFVLVREAQNWGEEVEWMFAILEHLAVTEKIPIVHIIFNGGFITIKEAYFSVRQGHNIIVLEGSAKATKAIIAAMNGTSKADLVDLLKKHEIATQKHKVEKTLSWLKDIADYNKITRFDFWSGHHEDLQKIILSKLGLG